jgi:hypothetical protein
MSRAIKFRAWDKENKKMLYPDGIYGLDMEENTAIISLYIAGGMNNVQDEFQEQYDLMQFTGKDNLYELDIIEFDFYFHVGFGPVKKETIRAIIEYNIYDCCFYAIDYKNQQMYRIPDVGNSYKIIGNKFENPELLI